MGPDFRVLVRKGQKKAQTYYLQYGVRRVAFCFPALSAITHTHAAHGDLPRRISPHPARAQESIPVLELVREMGTIMQEFTQSGGVRPFGVSLLIAGCVRLSVVGRRR